MPYPSTNLDMNAFSIYCICGGFGFPVGTASTKRIRLIGKCFTSSKIPFHVWHVGPSAFTENKYKTGAFDGIAFEYLSPSVRWPIYRIIRVSYIAWGFFKLFFRLMHVHKKSIVYVYYQGDLQNFLALWLCRLIGIPTVQEACEWWPGTNNGNAFTKWMYHRIMFKWSKGALVISQEIRNRIQLLAGLAYPICMVPVLIDPSEIKIKKKKGSNDESSMHTLLWCGMVDGYKRDVLFLIDALAELKSQRGQSSILRIIGPCTQNAKDELFAYAGSKNIPAARIDIRGFVSENELWEFCARADALLMPLWNDDRSITRFPTKLGQYLAAGRPIVTSQVGEITYYLNEKTALFYLPGDAASLAQSLDRLLVNPEQGDRIAASGTQEALTKFDFRSNAETIRALFYRIHSMNRND